MSSAPRLIFLYPAFIRPFLAAEAKAIRPRKLRRPLPAASFATCPRRHEELRVQRYGSANEPPPHLTSEQTPAKREGATQAAGSSAAPESAADKSATSESKTRAEATTTPAVDKAQEAETAAAEEEEEADEVIPTSPSKALVLDASESQPEFPPPEPPLVGDSNPLETVLQMPSPSEAEREHRWRPPHLDTPKYVHHFDTYSLVRRLEEGGWTGEQSVSLMKAVRSILSDNMDLAREGLVSKSNVENVSGVFWESGRHNNM